ncbi:hypothetical protein TRFO_28811 [Tritrichomonas foetus]|uniref:F5/8 type C domain-containing protein n=1 Tax=Tritrichomonas foetus TaxID=1144522 RepID=A0A1J4K1R4_9EUKA|nr:hypothetical protein TRFO_28811 [Tritrichomonas foetus]|eukprot:OHT03686.1 hypothetical protein TRFO_28811 [Tritrichomonas foetus]
MMTFQLSSDGIKRVKALSKKDNFRFIVDGKKYFCSKYEAVFFSPNVFNLMLLDSSMDEYKITTSYHEKYYQELKKGKSNNFISQKKKTFYANESSRRKMISKIVSNSQQSPKINREEIVQKDRFQEVIKLMKGEKIKIEDNDMMKYLMEVNFKLGNIELAEFLVSTKTTSLNVDNAIERLQYKFLLGVDMRQEIEYIASNFEAFPNQSFLQIEQSLIEMILSSNSFRIETEDSFYQKIKQFRNQGTLSDEMFKLMLQYVQIEFFNDEQNLNDYISVIGSNRNEFLNNSLIWNAIISRLHCQSNSYLYSKLKKRHNVINHYFQKDSDVFKFLKERDIHRKNPIESKQINITSSFGEINPSIIYEYNQEKIIFQINSQERSWLLIDFQNKKIKLSDFIIHVFDPCVDFIIHKIIEGSNDKENWTVLEEVQIDQPNHSPKYIINYKRDYEITIPYRYIRLTVNNCFHVTASYAMNSCILPLQNIQLFGEIFEYS